VISKLVSKFLNEKLDGVYGDLQYVNKDDTTRVVRLWKSRNYTADLLRKGWMPAHPTFFLKKEVYKIHGKFNLKYKIAADYDFMIRVLKDPSLTYGYMPCVITKMRVGGISNGGLKNIILKSKEDYEVLLSNNIGGVLTLFKKNISKLSQFIIR
jgi:glycosyltransferase